MQPTCTGKVDICQYPEDLGSTLPFGDKIGEMKIGDPNALLVVVVHADMQHGLEFLFASSASGTCGNAERDNRLRFNCIILRHQLPPRASVPVAWQAFAVLMLMICASTRQSTASPVLWNPSGLSLRSSDYKAEREFPSPHVS